MSRVVFNELFKSVVGITESVATVVLAPVSVVVEVADAALKPVAEVAKDLADDIKSAVK